MQLSCRIALITLINTDTACSVKVKVIVLPYSQSIFNTCFAHVGLLSEYTGA